MAKILNRLLAGFGIYQTDEAIQGPGRIDFASPVQPVHDVSRMAERAAADAAPRDPSGAYDHDGLFTYVIENNHPGAGVLTGSFEFSPANLSNASAVGTPIDLHRFRLRLESVAVFEESGAPNASHLWVYLLRSGRTPGNVSGVAKFKEALMYTNARTQIGTTGVYLYLPATDAAAHPRPQFPYWMGHHDSVYIFSQATAVGKIECACNFTIHAR